jgi:ankyrin repeat protein
MRVNTPSAADRADRYFAAVGAGDVDLVRNLLDEEPTLLATVSAEGVRGPLTALYAGHAALADELAARSEPLDIHEASAFDDNGRLRILLAEDPGAVRAWSLDGWQPLHLASYFGRIEAVRQLLDLDAPVDDASRNPMRVTPLHSAAAGSHSEIVWLLVASGARVDARQSHGWTPLHAAAANGDAESVRALLSGGASADIANDSGDTARDLARDEAVALLS